MNREQLKTILWLRWRLMCNQWRRSGGLGAVVTIFIGAGAVVLGMASFTGGLLGAIFGLGTEASPQVIMFVWLGVTAVFMFLWMIGLLTELQRSETIDLQKLMHLPVALGQMFTINYLVSHFAMSVVLVVPVMLGLGLGLAIERGPKMILLIPLALSMVLMITAWTYCLRGWLATMMTNPRKRRTVIMCITMVFILIAQGPNLYFNFLAKRTTSTKPAATGEESRHQREANEATSQKMFMHFQTAENFIPPFWVPVGAQSLAGGNALPALFGTLGCVGIAALGLRRAYRGTVRFYHGETGGKAAVKNNPGELRKISVPRDQSKIDFLERPLPFVPEQSAVIALGTLRSMLRAPEVKMTLGTSLIVTIIVGFSLFFRDTSNLSDAARPLLATASIVFPVFFLAQFFGNLFGFDRDGFRALILSPVDRHLILLGKNLAVMPVGVLFGGLFITFTTLRLHLAVETILATLFQLGAVLLLMSGLAGNLLSILLPYRIQPGSMKPTKLPGFTMLVLVFWQVLYMTVVLPVFIGPFLEFLWRYWQMPAFVPVNLIFSALLCGLMLLVYRTALKPLGRLLQRRETKILGVISVEVE